MTAATEAARGTRSSLIGLAGAAVSGLFGFVLAVVLARGFGPAGAGAIFAAIGLLTVVTAVSSLGADTGLVWALPRRLATTGPSGPRRPDGTSGDHAHERAPGPHDPPSGLLAVALIPPLLVAGVLAAAGVLLAEPVAAVLLPAAGGQGPRLIILAALAGPVTVTMTLLLAAVRAARPIEAYAAVQFVLLPVGRPLLIGAVAVASGGVVAALAGWLLPALAAAVLCMLLLRRPLGLRRAALRPARADWLPFWSFALPRAASAAIDSGSMWVGVLLTAALATQADAGVFGGVGRYVLAGQLAMQGLRVAIAPQLSRLLGAGHIDQAADVHRRTTVLSIVLCWPVYLLLAIFAPGLLTLFGGEFTAGATALAILAAAMLVNVGLGTVQTVLLMSGRSRAHLLATASGLICTVGLGLWWIPVGGLTGAAGAWAAGIVVENVIAAAAAHAVVGPAVSSRTALIAATATAAVVGAAGAVGVLLAGRGLAGLLSAAGILLAAVAAATVSRPVRAVLTAEIAALRGGRSRS